MAVRAFLEFYGGIGGFTAALPEGVRAQVTALEQSLAALETHHLNFPQAHTIRVNLEDITANELSGFQADFWWLSPPCQPYTVKGARRDLEDPRARSFAKILALLPGVDPPRHLALENVPGFRGSQAHTLLLKTLGVLGYTFQERLLCPTELGVPSRRERYYLCASRDPLLPVQEPTRLPRPLCRYLERAPDPALELRAEVFEKYSEGLRLLDPEEPQAYTTCFTSSYGQALMHSGSYLRWNSKVRRFSPGEIAALLHFPEGFTFPPGLALRKRWQLVGNSLSVLAVREVLKSFPDLH